MRKLEDSWFSVEINGRTNTRHDSYSAALKKCDYPWLPIKGWQLNDIKAVKKYQAEMKLRFKKLYKNL